MKRILWIALVNIIFLLSWTPAVNAQERREFYSGARCLAMGGACIAVSNDETALLVNPAGLGKLRNFFGTVFDPELEVTGKLPEFYRGGAFTNPFSLSEIKGALNKNRGDYYHAKGQIFPSFVGKNFGIGLYGNYLLDAQMSDDGATIDTYYRNDLAFVVGFNFRFFDGRVKLGANAKLISRIEVDNDAVDATQSLDYKNIGTEGVGLSTDVGLILAAPWKMIPTISAVLRDVGNTRFTQASGVRLETANRPNMVKQDLDVAVALFPIHSNRVRSTFTLEYRGLLTSQDEPDKAKLMHGGLELNLADELFLRAGYNQRYWTAGMEYATEHIQWQLTSYGEEVGTVNQPREDRRYIVKFSFRF